MLVRTLIFSTEALCLTIPPPPLPTPHPMCHKICEDKRWNAQQHFCVLSFKHHAWFFFCSFLFSVFLVISFFYQHFLCLSHRIAHSGLIFQLGSWMFAFCCCRCSFVFHFWSLCSATIRFRRDWCLETGLLGGRCSFFLFFNQTEFCLFCCTCKLCMCAS